MDALAKPCMHIIFAVQSAASLDSDTVSTRSSTLQ